MFGVLHQDGSLVDPENPARPGEELALVATGLGAGFLSEETANGDASAIPAAYLILGQVRVKPAFIQPVPNEPGLFLAGFEVPAETAEGVVGVSLLVDGFRANTLQVSVAAPEIALR